MSLTFPPASHRSATAKRTSAAMGPTDELRACRSSSVSSSGRRSSRILQKSLCETRYVLRNSLVVNERTCSGLESAREGHRTHSGADVPVEPLRPPILPGSTRHTAVGDDERSDEAAAPDDDVAHRHGDAQRRYERRRDEAEQRPHVYARLLGAAGARLPISRPRKIAKLRRSRFWRGRYFSGPPTRNRDFENPKPQK
jgi:hypothetical protein